MLEVDCITALTDNQVYFLTDSISKKMAILDPSEPEIVNEYLHKRKCNPVCIINTHHHYDHVGGNLALKKEWGIPVLANEKDKERIPGFDLPIGNSFHLGESEAKVIEVPGHTKHHIALHFHTGHLFCGDTLFVAGCGRVMEGSIKELFDSVSLIGSLPQKTLIYCGHDYSVNNLLFALSLEPENLDVKNALEYSKRGYKTIPSAVEKEMAINPFLRTNTLRTVLGFSNHAEELEVFIKLRKLKDSFS